MFADMSLTLSSILALLGGMLALAIVPDSSAIAVASRAMASGVKHAVMVIIGIAVGDYIFIIIALYGLVSIADLMSGLFDALKYFGGAYLILSGIFLWRSKTETDNVEGVKELSWISNFLTGFFITMGDPKAILFYMSFLTVFLDVANVTLIDAVIIMLIATVALFSMKMVYAYFASRASAIFNSDKAKKRINYFSGSVMMVIGIYLLVRI